jgi:hypothetical protein
MFSVQHWFGTVWLLVVCSSQETSWRIPSHMWRTCSSCYRNIFRELAQSFTATISNDAFSKDDLVSNNRETMWCKNKYTLWDTHFVFCFTSINFKGAITQSWKYYLLDKLPIKWINFVVLRCGINSSDSRYGPVEAFLKISINFKLS